MRGGKGKRQKDLEKREMKERQKRRLMRRRYNKLKKEHMMTHDVENRL